MVIKVISANELDSFTKKKVEDVFTKKHPLNRVIFVYEINAQMLGGLLVIDGDNYYDGTVRGQLSRIRRDILSN